MRSLPLSFIVIASLLLSACSTTGGGKSSGNGSPGSYCYEHPAVCGIAGALVVAGAFAILSHNGGSDCGGQPIRPHAQQAPSCGQQRGR